MAKHLSFSAEFVGSTTSPSTETAETSAETPFRIMVLGNFGGDRPAAESLNSAWRPISVDRDNLDDVLAKIRPALALDGIAADGSTIDLEFQQLDDFHPDQLVSMIGEGPILQHAAGAAPVPAASEAPVAPPVPAASPPPAISGSDLLAQMLDQSSDAPQSAAAQQASELQHLLAHVTEPYRVAKEDPETRRQAESAAAVLASRMRAVLHHPRFQALEAAWRSLDLLVRRIETDGQLRISIVDCGKPELAEELEAAANLRQTRLYKLLCEQPLGAAPWTLIIGDYRFGATQGDVEMLGRIAQIAAHARAPFVAAAQSTVFGCSSVGSTPDPDDWQAPEAEASQMWQMLRQLPAATALGLVCPRFLLRLPYGPNTSTTERIDFEELPVPHPAGYLWGNSAFLVACLLAQTFGETGWQMAGRLYRDIHDLPVHVYEESGESTMQPSAEAALGNRAAEQILDAGVMPLQAFQDRGSVRLTRLQSLADPAAPLSGRWE